MERVTLERVIDAWDEQVYGSSSEEVADLFDPILGTEGKLLSELIEKNNFQDECVEFLLLHFAPSDALRVCAARSIERLFSALIDESAPIPANALMFMIRFAEDFSCSFEESRVAMIEMDAMARRMKAKNDPKFALAWRMNNIVNAAYLFCAGQCKDDVAKNKLHLAIMRRCCNNASKEFIPGVFPQHCVEWAVQRVEIVGEISRAESKQ